MEYNAELRREIEKMKARAEEGQKKENSSVLGDDIEMIRKTAEETIDQLRQDSRKKVEGGKTVCPVYTHWLQL